MPAPELPPPTLHTLLTTADVARIARTGESTVRYWRHLGTGPRGFKVGRRVLYRPADVEAWLQAQEAADAGGAA
ncbi:helix-turn-helix transcriptional regulator [Kineococcus sp. TBRC 1896]|uniref:Helix-turn-helix transcriptional regulator n=1 Tax=Kineococcus mangrovi TaxID=1660183 RepID=A0ABV4HX05_9ACTN